MQRNYRIKYSYKKRETPISRTTQVQASKISKCYLQMFLSYRLIWKEVLELLWNIWYLLSDSVLSSKINSYAYFQLTSRDEHVSDLLLTFKLNHVGIVPHHKRSRTNICWYNTRRLFLLFKWF